MARCEQAIIERAMAALETALDVGCVYKRVHVDDNDFEVTPRKLNFDGDIDLQSVAIAVIKAISEV